jgi:hypothetical protein
VSQAPQRNGSVTVPLGTASLTSVAVLVVALLVQRTCVGEHEGLIPWLWGSVAIAALLVWVRTGRIVLSPR